MESSGVGLVGCSRKRLHVPGDVGDCRKVLRQQSGNIMGDRTRSLHSGFLLRMSATRMGSVHSKGSDSCEQETMQTTGGQRDLFAESSGLTKLPGLESFRRTSGHTTTALGRSAVEVLFEDLSSTERDGKSEISKTHSAMI